MKALHWLLPALLLVGASPGAAQEQESPVFFQIHSMDLPAGTADEWKALVDELKEGLSKTDHPGFTMWEVIQGPRGRFHLSRQARTLAELEPRELLSDVWDEAKRDRWWKRFGELVTHTHTAVWRGQPELSSPLPPDAKGLPRYIEVRVYRHAPGKGPEFRNFLEKTAKPARDKAGVHGIFFRKRVSGGSPREWLRLRGFNDWAGLEDRRLAESMGEEAFQEMLLEGGRMLDDVRVELLRFREDLSFIREDREQAAASRR